jgi:hypothetical protein
MAPTRKKTSNSSIRHRARLPKIQCYGCKKSFRRPNVHYQHCRAINAAENNDNNDFVLQYGSVGSHPSHSQFLDSVVTSPPVPAPNFCVEVTADLPFVASPDQESSFSRGGNTTSMSNRTIENNNLLLNFGSSYVNQHYPVLASGYEENNSHLDSGSENDVPARKCSQIYISNDAANDHASTMFTEDHEDDELYDIQAGTTTAGNFNADQSNENSDANPGRLFLNLITYQKSLETHYQTLYIDKDTMASMNLFALLQSSNAPLHLYDSMRQFIIETTEGGNIPRCREQLLKICHSIIMIPHESVPKLVPLNNHGSHTNLLFDGTGNLGISVTRLPFVSLVASLLSDKILTQQSNLLIDDPLYHDRHYNNNVVNDNIPYGDIHTGYWFQGTKHQLCREDNDLLCPVMFFIDGVSIDSAGRLSLEPVSFTLGIYNRRVRNLSSAWRILGFIERTDHLVDPGTNQTRSKRRLYHDVLRLILEDYLKVQGVFGGIKWNLPVNGERKVFNLKFSVCFVIGDAVGHDKLTGRYSNYHNTNFITRDCNCDRSNSDNPNVICEFTKAADIRDMSETQKNNIGYHHIINNAFDEICFGILSAFGINGCTPHEKLHFWNLGTVTNLLKFFLNRITVPAKQYLFKVLKKIVAQSSRQSDRTFPDISIFKDDIEKPKLTAEEVIHQLFLIVIGLSSSSVREMITRIENSRITKHRTQEVTYVEEITGAVKKKRKPLNKLLCNLTATNKWYQFFEWTLCLDQFLNSDDIPRSCVHPVRNPHNDGGGSCILHESLRRYMTTYKSLVVIPGDKNVVNLKTMKFHALLHIPRQIRLFGSPTNYAGFRPEATGKDFAKNTGRRTQKRQASISKQTMNRYVENLVVGLAQNTLIVSKGNRSLFTNRVNITNSETASDQHDIMITSGSTSSPDLAAVTLNPYSFTFNQNQDESISIKSYTSETNRRPTQDVPFSRSSLSEDFLKSLANFLLQKNLFEVPNDVDTIHCFTTLKYKNMLIRADPNFHGGKWFDWVNIDWSYDSGSSDNYPAQVLTFVDLKKSGISFNKENLMAPSDLYIAIVKSTTSVTNSNRINSWKGKLVKELVMETALRAVGYQNISGTAYVIPSLEDNNDNGDPCHHVRQLLPLDNWGDLALSYVVD